MKKIIALLLIVLLSINFTACGKIKEEEVVGSWKITRSQVLNNDQTISDSNDFIDIFGKDLEEMIKENAQDIQGLAFRIIFSSDKNYTTQNFFGDKMAEGTWRIINSTDIELTNEHGSGTYRLEDGLLIYSYIQDYTKEELTKDWGITETIRTYSKEN